MKILVTGAGGQLGRSLRDAVAGRCDGIFFASHSALDVCDAAAVDACIDALRPDAVINCAAYTDVERAEDDAERACAVNCTAAANVAAAAGRCGALMIHVSTDYVFDGEALCPYAEYAPTAPLSVYGRTKLAGEQAVAASGCRYAIVRTSWLYSQYGRNFVRSILRLCRERNVLRVVNDQTGSPTYARNLAHALLAVAERDMRGVLHYSDEGACTRYDFACEIVRLAGCGCTVEPCASEDYGARAQRPKYSALDTAKAVAAGIAVQPWRDALAACIAEIKREDTI